MKDILRTLVMAEHFCDEQSCGLCNEALQTAQKQVVLAQQTTNSSSMQCTCGYVRTDGKGKIYRVDNEFGKCKVHCIL